MSRLLVPTLTVLLSVLLYGCDPNRDGNYSICPTGTVGIDYADPTAPETGFYYAIQHTAADGSVSSSFHVWAGETVRAEEGDLVTVYPYARDPESGIQRTETTVSGEYTCAIDLDIVLTEVLQPEIVALYVEAGGADCGTVEPTLPNYGLAFGGSCEPVDGNTGSGTYHVFMESQNHAGAIVINLMTITNETGTPGGPIIIF